MNIHRAATDQRGIGRAKRRILRAIFGNWALAKI
jgi:hypothetical protein